MWRFTTLSTGCGAQGGARFACQVKSLDWVVRKASFNRKIAPRELAEVRARIAALVVQLGFEKIEREGSRVVFLERNFSFAIRSHKSYPENHIKGGALKDTYTKKIWYLPPFRGLKY